MLVVYLIFVLGFGYFGFGCALTCGMRGLVGFCGWGFDGFGGWVHGLVCFGVVILGCAGFF